jgi:hypothetical protein
MHASFNRTREPDIKELAKHVTIAPEFLGHARAAVSPGTTLIITDVRVTGQTHSGSEFTFLALSDDG